MTGADPGGALGDHRPRGLDRSDLPIGGLVGAGAGADVEHAVRLAQSRLDLCRDPRLAAGGRRCSRVPSRSYAASAHADALHGPLEQQLALAGVLGERRRALELGARLVAAAELGEQVAAHAGQQVVARRAPARDVSASTSSSPAAGPNAIADRDAPGSARPPAMAASWASAS